MKMLKNFALASLTALVTLLACSTHTPIGAANQGSAGTTGTAGVSPGTAGLQGGTAGTFGDAGTTGTAGGGSAGVSNGGSAGFFGTAGVVGTAGSGGGQDESAGEVACMTALAAGKPGGSMFLAEKLLPGVANFLSAGVVALGDLNGDQKADIAAVFSPEPVPQGANAGTSGGFGGSPANETLGIFLTNGTGDFGAPVTYTNGVGGINSLATGDVDGDGKVDLVSSDGDVQVFANKGAGALADPVTYAVGTSQGVGLGDLNGDGRLDIVTATQSVDQSSVVRVGLSVLTNAGAGSFIGSRYAVADGYPQFVVGDLNGDGKPDVATSGASSVNVLLNDGLGGLLTAKGYAAPPASFLLPGDVDGDGKTDLVVGDYRSANVLHNLGNGTFAVARKIADADYAFTLADVNSDQKPDLVAVFPGCSSVGVFLNDGAGGFGSVSYYPVTHYSVGSLSGPTIGDVNGDGRPDIVVTNGKGVSVLLHAAP